MNEQLSRNNHYVPEWFQRGFLSEKSDELFYLDLKPDDITGKNDEPLLIKGKVKKHNRIKKLPPSKCFCENDLYTTFFGEEINDEIERILFGKIDNDGARAIKAFVGDDLSERHKNFNNLFEYIDIQKIRTPKGLNWIKGNYSNLEQNALMIEMQKIRTMHCGIWSKGVKEIVSAESSDIKFILSDHPVTIYNYACPPSNEQYTYPNDPSIQLKATQTIFPLNMNNCLILTNLEYAKTPNIKDPLEKHINAHTFSDNILVDTTNLIKSRFLDEKDIEKINFIIKSRARRYVAAIEKDWLYPEKRINLDWSELRQVLLPPESGVCLFGGEIIAKLRDGSMHYQDEYGRTTPENKFLWKEEVKGKVHVNDPCPCGSGKKYKKCCKGKKTSERPSWKKLSIRERNLKFFQGIFNILGLASDKTWDDVRRELSDGQVHDIHHLYALLWPKETDFMSLLPKPDGILRALYTGFIDYRFVSFISMLPLYFDEIIIQSPFITPYNLIPELDPIKNPHKYKQKILNDILLFFQLSPFIESGFINFIPNIGMFDGHLQKQIFDSAQEQKNPRAIPDEELRIYKKLRIENEFHTICSSSKEIQKSYLRKIEPPLSDEEIKKLIKGFEIEKQQNPLVLLQDNAFNKGEKQVGFTNPAPDFEMSLFIAQITGSLLLTNSPSRWDEIEKSQKSQANLKRNWNDLSDCINDFEYILYLDSQTTLQLRQSGKLGNIRKSLKEIYSSIQGDIDHSRLTCLTEMLKKQFTKAYKISKRELSDEKQNRVICKFKCVIPTGGIEHINVQRMLLSSGSTNHLKSVPMAIFLDSRNKGI